MRQITAPELAEWLADPQRPAPLLLDVREPWETALCALPDSVAIPMAQIVARADELDPARQVDPSCPTY